jgi:hypothetical protein
MRAAENNSVTSPILQNSRYLGHSQCNHQPERQAVIQKIIAVIRLGCVGLQQGVETEISSIGLSQE